MDRTSCRTAWSWSAGWAPWAVLSPCVVVRLRHFLKNPREKTPSPFRRKRSYQDAKPSAGNVIVNTTPIHGPRDSDPTSPSDETMKLGSELLGRKEPNLGFLSPSQRPDALGRPGHYEVLEVLGQGAYRGHRPWARSFGVERRTHVALLSGRRPRAARRVTAVFNRAASPFLQAPPAA